jgi:AraC family transcriptional regulator
MEITREHSVANASFPAGVSASHLNTLFGGSMQMAVHQYVIQRRVELAKTLLLREEMSITEVALAAGFAHQSHLAPPHAACLGNATAGSQTPAD